MNGTWRPKLPPITRAIRPSWARWHRPFSVTAPTPVMLISVSPCGPWPPRKRCSSASRMASAAPVPPLPPTISVSASRMRPAACAAVMMLSMTARVPSCGLLLDLAGDDQPLDLVGALVDLGKAHVAEDALDAVVARVAVAAVDLERIGDVLHRHVGREQLGLRGLLGDRLAGIVQACGVMDQKPRSGDVGRHVREHELNRLEADDGLAELPAVAGIGGGVL